MTNPADVLDALQDLETVARGGVERLSRLVERIESVREGLGEGKTLREITENEPRPLIVELATENLEALLRAGCRVRRLKAAVLHDEGMTMDQIAAMFGVSRQRISALIREKEAQQT